MHTLRSYKLGYRVSFICENNARLNMKVKEYSDLKKKAEKLGFGKEIRMYIRDHIQSMLPKGIGVVVETLN